MSFSRDMPPELSPPTFPELPAYDWEGATRKLTFYFSRRGLMNASDLTQETLTRVVGWLRQKGNTIEGENGFMKTVFGFARLVKMEAFKMQRHTTEELPQDLPSVASKTLGLNGLDAVLFLRGLLEKLPEPDRKLIVAVEEGAPQASLAAEMNLPVNTLRVKLHRARERLREMEVAGPDHRLCQ